jgi:hypothetical protein
LQNKKWEVQQLDIKAPYPNTKLDKTIYIHILEGAKDYKMGLWKLNKTLYGLKQARRQ